jgi:hypothetical protein
MSLIAKNQFTNYNPNLTNNNQNLHNNNNEVPNLNKRQQNNVLLSQKKSMLQPALLSNTFSVDKELYDELTKEGGNLKLKNIIDEAQKNFPNALMNIDKNDRPFYTKRIENFVNNILKLSKYTYKLKHELIRAYSKDMACQPKSNYRLAWLNYIALSDKLDIATQNMPNLIIKDTKEYNANLNKSLCEITGWLPIRKHAKDAEGVWNTACGAFPKGNPSKAAILGDYSNSMQSVKGVNRLYSITKYLQLKIHSKDEIKLVHDFVNINNIIRKIRKFPADIHQSCSLEVILKVLDKEIENYVKIVGSEMTKDKKTSMIRSIVTEVNNLSRRLSTLQSQLILQNQIKPAQNGLTL